MPTSRPLPVLCPERVRRPPKSFAWLDRRLRAGGFLARLTPEESALYCFLALAADAQGLSCWRVDRMERALPCGVPALMRARAGLLRADLLAFRPWHAHCPDGSYQLLALPAVTATMATPGCVTLGQVLSSFGGMGR